MRTYTFLIISLICTASIAQNDTSPIYSGGMFLQSGYISTSNVHGSYSGVPFGLGGILRFYTQKHIVWGLTGGTSSMKYGTSNYDESNASLGHGGAFLGYYNMKNKWRFCAFLYGGMGKYENLHIESKANDGQLDAWLYEQSTPVLAPYLTLDYFLTKKLALTLQSSYLWARNGPSSTIAMPVMQFGILFNR